MGFIIATYLHELLAKPTVLRSSGFEKCPFHASARCEWVRYRRNRFLRHKTPILHLRFIFFFFPLAHQSPVTDSAAFRQFSFAAKSV